MTQSKARPYHEIILELIEEHVPAGVNYCRLEIKNSRMVKSAPGRRMNSFRHHTTTPMAFNQILRQYKESNEE